MLELLAALLILTSFRPWRLGKQSLLSFPPQPVPRLCSHCSRVCQAEEFSGFPEALGPRSALAPAIEM